MDCVLHIGMHKTGTSSIQESLAGYDDGTVRYADLGLANHSVPLATIFADAPETIPSHRIGGRSRPEIEAMRAVWRASLKREIDGSSRRVILSAESLTTLPAGALKRLRDFVTGHGRAIRVVAYVREPLSFANSAFQQRLRGGETRLYVPRPNYRKRFEKVIEVFGRAGCDFVEYDRSRFPGGSVVLEFATRVGVMPEGMREQTANSALSQDAARLLLEFNRHGPPSAGSAVLSQSRQALIRTLRFDFTGPAFGFPDPWLRNAIHPADIGWLGENTGIVFGEDWEALAADAEPPGESLPPPGRAARQRLADLLRAAGLDAGPDAPSLELTIRLFRHFVSECGGPSPPVGTNEMVGRNAFAESGFADGLNGVPEDASAGGAGGT